VSKLVIDGVKYLVGINELVDATIIVEDGIITSVSKKENTKDFDFIIHAGGLIAMPGGIDIHAHIYDPGYIHHEDFRTGSVAAAFGGITTFYDMPLRMYVEDLRTLQIKRDAGISDSLINFGVIAGMMNEDNIGRVMELRSEGVRAFKLFTCKPFRPKHDSTFSKVIYEVDRARGLTMIHCEDDSLMEYLMSRFRSEGRNDPLAHHESRPPEVEAAAIRRVVSIAHYLNARIHIVHVSSALGAEEVRNAKGRGLKITAETCPHYLYFTRDDVRRWGNYLKMNPALKDKEDVKALWRALSEGIIDVVTSDHAPSPKDEKETDVWNAWGGIPGLETMLPLIYTVGFKKLGLLSLRRYTEVTSENPARIMGIYPRKGTLSVGADADIVLLDPNLCIKVKGEELHHKVGWTPYEGLELCGWPKYVIVNGEILIQDRELNKGVKPGTYLRS